MSLLGAGSQILTTVLSRNALNKDCGEQEDTVSSPTSEQCSAEVHSCLNEVDYTRPNCDVGANHNLHTLDYTHPQPELDVHAADVGADVSHTEVGGAVRQTFHVNELNSLHTQPAIHVDQCLPLIVHLRKRPVPSVIITRTVTAMPCVHRTQGETQHTREIVRQSMIFLNMG
jgi:hypothetical protein